MYLVQVEFIGENFGNFPRQYVINAWYANDAINKLNKQIKKDIDSKSLDYHINEMRYLEDTFYVK